MSASQPKDAPALLSRMCRGVSTSDSIRVCRIGQPQGPRLASPEIRDLQGPKPARPEPRDPRPAVHEIRKGNSHAPTRDFGKFFYQDAIIKMRQVRNKADHDPCEAFAKFFVRKFLCRNSLCGIENCTELRIARNCELHGIANCAELQVAWTVPKRRRINSRI